ncbi:NAD-dependent epimerase/dehydratase family protein [Pelagicoccus mobilis]|uniref:NAD-dependent epimerase/dehydratase family protein n=2 Tax=Pelagicoccus mobilis TaxID=415221 RepID=A0A934S3G1_9BACT|nr:NAD-dependent epimerase/dehydratase family protein [Pelagicoccus mobilis]
MRGKRLLILGCGYLGRFLVADAVARGMKVLAVSRNLDTLRDVEALGATGFCGMVDESAWHDAAGQDVDFVVNCVSSAGGGLEGYRQSYLKGNESLCDWAERVGFEGAATYTSSVSACGDAAGKWVDEKSCPLPGNERGKIVAESERLFLERMTASSKIVLRLAGLYGPGRHLMLDRLKTGPAELPGWADYYLNLVRIEDVASSIWACFESEELSSELFNVVDDQPALKGEMVSWLAEKLGVGVPDFVGASSASGVGSRRLGEKGPPANRRIRNRALRESTGWSPRFSTFREGFADLMD